MKEKHQLFHTFRFKSSTLFYSCCTKDFVGDLITLDSVISSLKRSYKVAWCDINPFRHVSMNKREKHEVE